MTLSISFSKVSPIPRGHQADLEPFHDEHLAKDEGEEATGKDPGNATASTVLGVGIATLDLINEVATYPEEDAEVRASAQRRLRGGNATNSLVVLAQLGHRCRWVGTLGEDAAGDLVLADLARHGVAASDVVRVRGGTTPTSYVVSSRANGSRTIVHFRDLPELGADAFERVSLGGVDWVHFEGRNPRATASMIRRARRERSGLTISLELEKTRPDIDSLLDGPDVLLASRGFAEGSGFSEPEPFLKDLLARTTAELCVVGWGAHGAAYLARGGIAARLPAHVPPQVVDTLGAGDVFNAGVIDALLRGRPAREAVAAAIELAGRKCGQWGLTLAKEDV